MTDALTLSEYTRMRCLQNMMNTSYGVMGRIVLHLTKETYDEYIALRQRLRKYGTKEELNNV